MRKDKEITFEEEASPTSDESLTDGDTPSCDSPSEQYRLEFEMQKDDASDPTAKILAMFAYMRQTKREMDETLEMLKAKLRSYDDKDDE